MAKNVQTCTRPTPIGRFRRLTTMHLVACSKGMPGSNREIKNSFCAVVSRVLTPCAPSQARPLALRPALLVRTRTHILCGRKVVENVAICLEKVFFFSLSIRPCEHFSFLSLSVVYAVSRARGQRASSLVAVSRALGCLLCFPAFWQGSR